MAFITENNVAYNDEYIRELIFDRLDGEGKEESLDNIYEASEFLRTSCYLEDIDNEMIESGGKPQGIDLNN